MKPEKVKILAVEDSPADFYLLKEILSETSVIDFELMRAQTFKEALGLLGSQNFDIVLLDLGLPDSAGIENIERLSGKKPEIPIVVLTGLEDEKTGIASLQKSAQDYLIKGKMQSDSLVKSIRYAIERKRSEVALRKSEERYRDLVESSNSIIMRADKDLNITYMNDFGLKFFGYTAEELIGKNVIGTTIPEKDDKGRDLAAMAKNIPRYPEKYQTNVHQNMRKNRELVWVSWTNKIKYDQDGKLVEILAIGNNIEQVKKAEEALRTSRLAALNLMEDAVEARKQAEQARDALELTRNKLTATIENSPVGIAVTDAKGGTIHSNAVFDNIWRKPWPPAYDTGDYKKYQAWWADTGKPVLPEEWPSDKVIRTGKPVTGPVMEIQRFDGSRAFILNSAAPIFDAEGRLAGSVVAITDITERKHREMLSQALNEIYPTINSTLDFNEILRQAVVHACKAIGAESAALSFRKGDSWIVDYICGSLEKLAGAKMTDEEERHAGLSINTKQVVVINDAFTDKRVNREHMRKYNVRSVMVIPLVTKEEAMGAIFLNHHTAPVAFTKVQIDFAEKLSVALSLAMENAKLFEALQKSHDKLETRVQERTAELMNVVGALNDEMAERKQAEQALKSASMYTRSLIESSLDPLVTISAKGKIMDVNRATELITGTSRDKLIGSRFIDYFTEPEKAHEAYKKAFSSGAIRDYPLAIRHPSGFATEVLYNATLYRNESGEIQGVLAAARDVTERNETERRTNAINALLSLFSRKPSRKEYLDAVVDLMHSWTGCRCIGIRTIDDKGYIPYESYVGFSREFWESENRLSIERDQCVCIRVVTGNPDPQDGSVMTSGGSFHCDDTVAFVGRLSAEEKARFRGVCIQNGFLSLTVVPIRYSGRVLGIIHLADEERKKISLPFIEFLESMTPLIGEAINHFTLEDELRESETRLRFLSSQLLSVQEDERKRISAELHDDIAAKLAAIKFSLEKKLLQIDKATDKTNQSLKDIVSMVIDTIVSTRRIMINLRPAMIDDLGILATLNWHCREFEQIFSAIRVEKQVRIEENEIPENLKIVIFRIVQEGMNNVVKHSSASYVLLKLEKINDFLLLSIEDNGRGFDLEEKKTLNSGISQGFGMINMEERARFSGGEFSINSSKEKGTFIKVTWPLKPIEPIHHLRIEPS